MVVQGVEIPMTRLVEFCKANRIRRLALFGSILRPDFRSESDIDVLVEFKGKATFDGYMDLKFYLETLLGRNVDLITHDAVKPRMRPMIEQEAIHVT